MQKVSIYIVFLLILIIPQFVGTASNSGENEMAIPDNGQLYTDMKLQGIINYNAFQQIVSGWHTINAKKKDIITLIDFSKPSTEKRLYIFDLIKKKLLLSSYVAHGRNSGENFATSFSNEDGSCKSSLGFYLTENTYQGKNGYSLIINGLEKGINDHAKERAIVIHGAAYCNPDFLNTAGRLGRSQGCPALPQSIADSVINIIKDGSILYIYANDPNYICQSKMACK